MPLQIEVPRERIAELCHRWHIKSFAVFGSAIRGDFRSDSDVDVLIDPDPVAGLTLFDLAGIRDDLKTLFGREVDVVTRNGIASSKNIHRRDEILSTAEVIHEE